MADHGGSLVRAQTLFPHAPKPFVDLSTGINPHSYPLFDLPATALTRLPEPSRTRELCAVAARAYGAPSAAHVVASPGTQILLSRVYSLVQAGRALVFGPTYAEHRHVAALCGHDAVETGDLEELGEADLAVVVNPNNPDGRIVSRDRLRDLAARLRARGGLLVVDEAFMDVGPREQSLCDDVNEGGIVVLRSFGKFFGLAGVRLGFAVAPTELAAKLANDFGPWAVSGPALEHGLRALGDLTWQSHMRKTLDAEAVRLDALLTRYGVTVDGGTSLFRHVTMKPAPALHRALGERGIVVRTFAERPDELRFGLPGGEAEWERLELALVAYSQSTEGELR